MFYGPPAPGQRFPDDLSPAPVTGTIILSGYSFLIGTACMLLCISSLVFRQREGRNRPSWIFFTMSTLGLAALVIFSVAEIRLGGQEISRAFRRRSIHQSDPPAEGYGFMGQRSVTADGLWKVLLIIQAFLPILSDTAILYRTSMIWRRSTLSLMLIGAWIASFVTGVLYIGLYLRAIHTSDDPRQRITDHAVAFLCYGLIGLSTFCNIVATSVTGAKLWSHRRYLRKDLGIRNPRMTQPQRVLALLVESGTVYCVFQLVYVGLVAAQIPGIHMGVGGSISLVRSIYTGVSGLYPALLFFALNVQSLYFTDDDGLGILDSVVEISALD